MPFSAILSSSLLGAYLYASLGSMEPFLTSSQRLSVRCCIPSSWELQNGLDPEQNDAQADPDKDGKTNEQEYKDGTDPQVKN